MLLGLNDYLERVLEQFSGKVRETDKDKVIRAIAMSVAAGDNWFVPAEAIADGMNETDYEEGKTLKKLPGLVKKEIISSEGQRGFFAFTSLKKLRSREGETIMTVQYPAEDLLGEIAQADPEMVFVLNPWAEGLQFSAQDAVGLLDAAASVDPNDVLRQRRYVLEPRAYINVQEIIDGWNDGWSDNGDEQYEWAYKCCPIMADGRILLLFESHDKIYGGKNYILHVDHTITHYRVLEYQMKANGL